jgi:hypothetical protein
MGDDDLMTIGKAQSIGLCAVYATCTRFFRPHRLPLDNLPNAIRLRPGATLLVCSDLKFAAGADWRAFSGPPMTSCEAPLIAGGRRAPKSIARAKPPSLRYWTR